MNITWKWLTGAIAGLGMMAASSAMAADISGAGATFPFPIYSKWAAAYQGVAGTKMNYQSIGSGGGIKQIKARTVDFGASDMPLKSSELAEGGMTQFPTVIGGVVPVVNISGITGGQITLDGKTLGDIFLGKIANWSDPAIAALNPGVNLPNQAIVVVHRSDGSGTTFLFADYLSKVSPDWKSRVGAATSVEWPVGIGAKGNEGVAGNVAQTSGSIGYVEFAYAKQNRLAHVKMINHDGQAVSPTADAFAAAAAGADWGAVQDFNLLLTDAPGAASWPITGATFIIVYKQPQDPARTGEVLKFFKWAYENGDDMALGLDYVPLPDNVVQLIEQSWAANIQATM